MTYVRFGLAALALSLGITAAGAFEIVDNNNGFAGPAFRQSDPDGDIGPAALNSDDFGEAHINSSMTDHEKQFDGYSYSGFTFEDQIDQRSVKVDQSSTLTLQDEAKPARKH